jgi:hypothetical protein
MATSKKAHRLFSRLRTTRCSKSLALPRGTTVKRQGMIVLTNFRKAAQFDDHWARKFINDNPPGCPSLAFTFGYFQHGMTDPANVISMICFQKMQEVMTNVTFRLDELHAIDTRSPPVPDESSIRHLENGNTSSFTFEYRLQNNLWYVLETYKNGTDMNAFNSIPSTRLSPPAKIPSQARS